MDDQLDQMLVIQPAKALRTLRRLVAFGTIASVLTLSFCVPMAMNIRQASSCGLNFVLGTWLAIVTTLQLSSMPLRLQLWVTLLPDDVNQGRQQLVGKIRGAMQSLAWRLNRFVGSASQLFMLFGAVLSAMIGTSSASDESAESSTVHHDARLRRAVMLGTAALASRTVLSIVYFSCTFGENGAGASCGTNDPVELERRQRALRAQLAIDSWKDDSAHAEQVEETLRSASGCATPSTPCSACSSCSTVTAASPHPTQAHPALNGALQRRPSAQPETEGALAEAEAEGEDAEIERNRRQEGRGEVEQHESSISQDKQQECSPATPRTPCCCTPCTPSTPASTPCTPTPKGLDAGVACPVCLEDLQEGDATARLPCAGVVIAGKQGHVFHEACILPWLTRQARCPMCLHELDVE